MSVRINIQILILGQYNMIYLKQTKSLSYNNKNKFESWYI